ncbi:Cytochrome P450 [Mycena sanguinolenta]|uniref:Cytochrome P450 n=1 Tax=Mycena sanguinolenta TaxID=230812 RepID=A0A8H7D4J2_9AGAR|nr:Cytochrome P450 [Mycena sanguinolenta]
MESLIAKSMNSSIALATSVAVIVGYFVLRRRSTIRNIPGPPCHSWIYGADFLVSNMSLAERILGNMLEVAFTPTYGEHEFLWQKAYGSVYRFTGCFGDERLMVADPMALQYILNSPHFALSSLMQNMIDLVFGEHSLIGLRGQTHKRIRNEFNIGFTAAAVRDYQPIFEKFAQATSQQLEASDAEIVDISPLLGKATVAAIAEATLGYSLEELGEAYQTANAEIMTGAAYHSPGEYLFGTMMMRLPPWLLRVVINLPTKAFDAIRRTRSLALQIGARAVQGKQALAQQGLDIDTDLFGLLLDPQNSDTTRDKLTSEEIISQTGTMMVAGHETTTNTMLFGLLELAKNAELQDELRAEIHSMAGAGDNHAYDSMPLLNAFIKESLRFYPAEPSTERMALQDTVIPLSEGLTTISGERISQIPVRKGQIVIVGIASYQRHDLRWGENPNVFRPARWLEGTVSKGDAIGPYSNLLTFLGGPHTCLGWRFALLEMQVVICELIGKFSFALPEDENDRVIARRTNTLQPTLPNGKKGVPLRVTRVL